MPSNRQHAVRLAAAIGKSLEKNSLISSMETNYDTYRYSGTCYRGNINFYEDSSAVTGESGESGFFVIKASGYGFTFDVRYDSSFRKIESIRLSSGGEIRPYQEIRNGLSLEGITIKSITE